MRRLFLTLFFLFIAMPAWAVDDWGYTNCDDGSTVGSNAKICFDADSSVSTSAVNTFAVTATNALACLKTDIDQSGISATGGSPITAEIRYHPNSVFTTKAYGILVCGLAGCSSGATLTGGEGTAGSEATTQRACVTLGRGSYSVVFPTAPDSPDVGLFTVQGGQ